MNQLLNLKKTFQCMNPYSKLLVLPFTRFHIVFVFFLPTLQTILSSGCILELKFDLY